MKNIIVGAGVSGLTLADRLTAEGRGNSVTLIEREDQPGGLARSFSRQGFDFDIGPHRFHTANPLVDDYLREVLGSCCMEIQRKSSVFMAGKYRSWPLTLISVMGLPLPVLFRSFLDLFRKPDIPEIRSFADFIRSRYGDNLYHFFFAGYTKKFTGTSSEQLHVDWAQAGVNRAVIDKRVKADNLLSLLRGMLLPKPVETSFYYPSRGGIQTFCDLQRDRILKNGGSLLMGTPASGLLQENGKVTGVVLENGDVIQGERVFWTAPITILYPETALTFINTITANVALKRENPANDYQWCYFGQDDIAFSRLTVPRHFRENCVPPGKDSLIAEFTCTADSMEWHDPEVLEDRLIAGLLKVRAAREEDILFIDWKRVPETYPVYTLDYREKLASVSIPEGLFLTGRCGSFWYNNMDHSIAQALSFMAGTEYSRDFWKRG